MNFRSAAISSMDRSATPPATEISIPPNSSAWSHSSGKRILDVLVAGSVLVICLPLMVVVALIVAVTSTGPVLFRQVRSGQGGLPFHLLKFRTMTHRESLSAPGVTRRGDSRVTPVGRFLRRFKLDELPQLVNVLRGDMSLVGPRPDLPHFTGALAPEYRGLLELKPGLTGAATLQFRHEEELLAAVPEAELINYYVKTLLPRKARLDLAYAQHASFLSDLALLWRTAFALSS
jgi:lipopolysaccharide/colanic/teichoic acid biosynthesis glycosyltransferase